MCRNIRTLFNFEPPATEDEIRASALQFVRKLSGFNIPPRRTRTRSTTRSKRCRTRPAGCCGRWRPTSPPRDREVEAEKARARARERFA